MKDYFIKKMLFVIFALVFAGKCFSQDVNTVFKFLELSSSAHANALGGNNISIIEKDISLIYHNPALLGPELDKHLGFDFTSYMDGIKLGSVTFGKRLSNRSAWAIGMHYLDYGNFLETTPEDEIIGDFSAQDMALTGFYSYDFSEHLRGAFAIKAIYSSFAEFTSFAVGVDLGLNYYNVDNGFSGSLTFKNLGGQLVKYHETYEKMPWDIQLGITQQLEHAPLRFSVTAQHLNRWDLSNNRQYASDEQGNLTIKKDSFGKTVLKHFIFGVDFLPTKQVYVALGFNYKRKDDLSLSEQRGLTGFTVGAGVNTNAFKVGVAVSQMHSGSLSYSVSISSNLGALRL